MEQAKNDPPEWAVQMVGRLVLYGPGHYVGRCTGVEPGWCGIDEGVEGSGVAWKVKVEPGNAFWARQENFTVLSDAEAGAWQILGRAVAQTARELATYARLSGMAQPLFERLLTAAFRDLIRTLQAGR